MKKKPLRKQTIETEKKIIIMCLKWANKIWAEKNTHIATATNKRVQYE